MKKIVFLLAVVGLIFTSCQKEENLPEPAVVQPVVTTPTGGNGNGGTTEIALYVWVFNTFPTTNPMCDLDTMFNSILINGDEMVDSLERDMSSFVVANMNGINNTSITLYSLTFDAPVDILATPFTITMDANGSADVGGSTLPDVYMMVGSLGMGTGAELDFTSHCDGINTYTVVENIVKSDRYLLTNPCQ